MNAPFLSSYPALGHLKAWTDLLVAQHRAYAKLQGDFAKQLPAALKSPTTVHAHLVAVGKQTFTLAEQAAATARGQRAEVLDALAAHDLVAKHGEQVVAKVRAAAEQADIVTDEVLTKARAGFDTLVKSQQDFLKAFKA